MDQTNTKAAQPIFVIAAFAIVYVVWGSTYFFIQMAIQGFPPMLMGTLRFFAAGTLMLLWGLLKGERLFNKNSILTSAVVGILLLVGGNGAVIWVEQNLPSALVAILVSSSPIWFVLLDKPNWSVNFRSKATLAGLFIGFIGVVLLFSEQLSGLFSGNTDTSNVLGMLLLLFGSIAWSSGSLYSKHHPTEGSPTVNVAWQMILASLVFLPASLINQEFDKVNWQTISVQSWLALAYLVVFGSIIAYSAYVWLLQVRPATQVSTYAYVNPVIAVVLGVLFGHERISMWQIMGLVVILGSVLLINLPKYRQEKAARQQKEGQIVGSAQKTVLSQQVSLEK